MFQTWEMLKKDLVSAPIISAPDWIQLFEIMCDASDFAIGVVLKERIDNRQHVILYSSNKSCVSYCRRTVLGQHR